MDDKVDKKIIQKYGKLKKYCIVLIFQYNTRMLLLKCLFIANKTIAFPCFMTYNDAVPFYRYTAACSAT